MTPEQIKIYRNMSPEKKLEIAASFYFSAKALKRAGLKALHPSWSDDKLDDETRKAFLYASN